MNFRSDSSFNRMARNSVYVGFKFGLYTISGVLFIPFLLKHYGSGSYGLIALAGFLTQYVGLVSRCVGNSTARFLNIALNKNDWKQAREIFSTALVATIGIILLQIPIFALGIWKLDFIIDFPPEIAADFRILVLCNVLVFFTSLLTGIFITPIQAANRLDISSTLEAIRLCLRMGLLFWLIKTYGPRLWLIGVVDITLELAYGLVIFCIYRNQARDLTFKIESLTAKWIRPVLNMAGWSIVVALGGSLIVKTDIWMINRFVDKNVAGVYAALLVWPHFMKQVSKQLASVLAPVYMIDYARGNLQRVARLSLYSAKLLGCLMALVAGCVFVFAKPLLGLWLGDWAVEYTVLLRVLITYVVFTIGESVLWQVYVAMNKVHYAGIISLIAGILNIVISMTLIRMGFGAIGVASGTVVAEFLACAVAVPMGVCHLMRISFKVVGVNILSALMMLIVSLTSASLAVYVGNTSILWGGAVLMVLLIAGGTIVAEITFTKSEKLYIDRVLHELFSRVGLLKNKMPEQQDSSDRDLE